jgi:uncharacterized membrane protein YoaK (UPF0700 family)
MQAAAPSATQRKPDALPLLLLVITVTTGLVDAVSVLGLGNVFVALMTGNVLFIGFALAGAPEFQMAHNATALLAFLVGAVAAGRVALRAGTMTRRRWLLSGAALEGSLLLVAGFLARGYDMEKLAPDATYYALVALTSIAMGFRNGTVRKLGVADVPTTVMTLTLASFASEAAAGEYKGAARRLSSVACLLAGAVAGGLLVLRAGVAPALLCAAVIVIVATVAYACHPSSDAPAVAPAKT